MTPTDWDAARTGQDDELHRAHFGFCLGPCEHESCSDAHNLGEEAETGEAGA